MKFYTAVNCMDGRVQQPVLDYLTDRFGVAYVDAVTEPGPNGILNRQDNAATITSIRHRIDISVNKHHSVGIAVIGHYDCAGNPGDKDHQNTDTRGAVRFLRIQYPNTPIIGLWIDETWAVEEIEVSDDAR
jgi:hypothetical protein